MNIAPKYKTGDHVIVPSIYVLTKQSSSTENKWVHATILFVHPQFNWCSFKYDNCGVVMSTYNENIFYEDEFKEHMEMLARQAEEERERREREENGDFDDYENEKSEPDPFDDEPDDFDENEDYGVDDEDDEDEDDV